ESRGHIQIGDPFEEKLLIECCLDLLGKNLVVSMQDMGAAGILSSSSEIAHKSGAGIEIFCERIPLREDMEPWEIFLSESQERMLLIASPGKFDEVADMARHYGLECAVVGNVTSDGRYRVLKNGETIADLPVGILGDAPVIDWPSVPPRDLEERGELPPGMKSADPAADLLKLIGSVHGSSRAEIWTQYDCQVQLRTASEPGEPVSAIRVPDSDSLVAFAMEAEPWKCYADPKAGAMETMAQSIRVLALCGADVLGMTNCLNFPSPENPGHYYELSQCVDGLAQVCRDMDCPVVSGNVSLYNETQRGGIYPTPLVVTAGFVPHYTYFASGGHAHGGDLIFLAGPIAGSLGASRWQTICGCGPSVPMTPRGTTWRYDAEMERGFVSRAIFVAHKADIKKSARVVAGGGLAAALAKEAIFSGVGMTADIPDRDLTEVMFSEGGPRAVYIIPPSSAEKFLECWEGYPVTELGEVGGDALIIKNFLEVAVSDLRSAFFGGAYRGLSHTKG
ncbi:MAG: phosphoribosylformylglycinamidine synthase subunit PurL, partial [Synergistaceae bacterium]|nr:phosphoribosylformylglycinamidine synthase subunit PurL [Synergistaceae bacterium]